MRKFLATLALSTLGLGSSLAADDAVVVVELYTSQGCSSCPPADDILAEIAGRDNVIALGLHVDYWDYLGWKSRYRLVTPQMIFNGEHYVAGPSRRKAMMYIDMMGASDEPVTMALTRTGGSLEIKLHAKGGKSAPSDVHLVRYTPKVPVKIKRGENAGRNIDYVNVVTSWETVATWDGVGARTLRRDVSADGQYAVIVQKQNLGPVLVARRLD